ncbi:MAG TPA: ABC transporter permease [Thermomicrobiales bacterium]|nr:ABC transporter permease [Thermomicrobiales bacterium]
MNDPASGAISASAGPEPGRWSMYAHAFAGLLLRDLRVLLREFLQFLLRTIMQPFLFVFVFTYLMPKIGQGISAGASQSSFATILVPGLVSVAILIQGVTSVASPLAIELGSTREIEDRVMAPLPVAAVAIEKVTFSAVQSIIAAIAVFPFVYLVPTTPVSVHIESWPLLIVVVLLASFTAGSLGLVLGTIISPQQIGILFGILVTPIIFLGCVYYPWASLRSIRWVQIIALLNPLVYVSEGMRAALTPEVPHMPVWAFLGGLTVLLIALTTFGVQNFRHRVVD